MPITTRPSKRHTAAERQAIVARWRAIGQTAREFCQAEGLHPESFRRWRQKPAVPPAGDFVTVTPTATAAAPTGWALDVTLPNGARLHFRGEA